MDLILLSIPTALTILAAIAWAALRWGVDSRPRLPDDHRR